MNDILSWLTLIISAVSTLCTLVLSWILFKKEQNKTYLKERYELVTEEIPIEKIPTIEYKSNEVIK